ncbi:hypothetical protein TV39_08940 [Arthrobacter sp. SPG23]|nr:hypothetical protein TV39_08940 [Arthrobacter sp. SPG23]
MSGGSPTAELEVPWWRRKSWWKLAGKVLGKYAVGTAVAVGLAMLARWLIVPVAPAADAEAKPSDTYPSLVTAMGAILLLVSIAWERADAVTGRGSLRPADVKFFRILLVTSGFVATMAGVLADETLRNNGGIYLVVVGVLVMLILIGVGLFGTSASASHRKLDEGAKED